MAAETSEGIEPEERTTASQLYEKLASVREPFLREARSISELTIPSLMPPEGTTGPDNLRLGYQSIGARGINNLASKLLLALFPPNQPFFRLKVKDFRLQELIEEDGQPQDSGEAGLLAQIKRALSKIEQAVLTEVEAMGIRTQIYQALRQLIAAGNVLLEIPTDQPRIKFHKLDSYVVQRDREGNVLLIILKEEIDKTALDEDLQEMIKDSDQEGSIGTTQHKPGGQDNSVDVFTVIQMQDQDTYAVHQEVGNEVVPDSEGEWKKEDLPYLALRFSDLGLDYGEAYLTDFKGDLNSLDQLSKAMIEGSASASKVVWLVNPAGTTKARDLTRAKNGDFVDGNPEEVAALQQEKFNDFATVSQEIQRIEQRLSAAFLLNTSIQRAGERVTAEEIRFMAQELEDALGGVFSILATDLQLPMARTVMNKLQKSEDMPELPDEIVTPTIITGLDAIGRNHESNKLQRFVATMGNLLGPEMVFQFINARDLIYRIAAAEGLNTEGLIKTVEQIQQESQQQQIQGLIDKLGPNAVNKLGDMAKEQMSQEGGGQSQPTTPQQ